MTYVYIGLIIWLIILPTKIQSKFDDIQNKNLADFTSKLTIQRTNNFQRILNYIRKSKEFQPFMVSLLLFEHTKSNILESLLHKISIDYIQGYRINANDFIKKCTWKDQIQLTWILPIDDLRHIQDFLHEQLWKTRNQYLIIFIGEEETSRNTWKEIFEKLWLKFNVYRIIVTFINDNFQCFLTYHPFDKISNGFGKIHELCFDEYIKKNQTNSIITVLSKNIELFENFENVNGYPIKVTVFPSLMMNINEDKNNIIHYTKLDANVMKTLENNMNAYFNINVLNYKDDVDPFHESLRNIEDNKSEIILTSLFVKTYNDKYSYEFTVGIEVDKLCFIAPTMGYLPKSYMPFLPFKIELWILLIFYNLFVTIFWIILRYLSYSFRNNKPIDFNLKSNFWYINGNKFTQDFLLKKKKQTYSNLINKKKEPSEIHPYVIGFMELMILFCYPFERAYTPALRIFLCSSLLFGLVISGLYNNWLMWTLSKPLKYPEINTIEYVANSNYTIVTKYLNLQTDTFTGNDTMEIKLRNKIKVINTDKPTNYLVAFDRRFISLGRYTSIKLENYSIYYDQDGNKLIHVVEECPITYTLSYVIRLNSPYIERINALLLRMQQFGFINFWYEQMKHPFFVEDEKMKLYLSEQKKKLTLEHYSLTFLGLFIGLIGCLIVFLAEIHYGKYKKC